MTKAELIKLLESLPDDVDIVAYMVDGEDKHGSPSYYGPICGADLWEDRIRLFFYNPYNF